MELEPNQAEYLPLLYDKLNGYVRNEVRTGFREWMFEDAIHEYLHRYFHEQFTKEVQIEANYDKGESVIQVEVDGATMFLNWYNSCIFTHLKKYDQVDHIFIGSEEGDESVTQGTFIFRQVLENFDEVVDYLDDYNFPHIHKPYPSETDTETYLKAAETDLDKADEIAAYWEKEGS